VPVEDNETYYYPSEKAAITYAEKAGWFVTTAGKAIRPDIDYPLELTQFKRSDSAPTKWFWKQEGWAK